MRLFIAAELPSRMTDAMAETSAELRAHVRGRYVAPDSFHVTLAFLGDVEAARVDDAVDALEEGCRGYEPFEVALGELGSFGRRAKAALWQGFADAGELPDLARSVRADLEARGIAFDDKPFLPHVTLMRSADLSAGVLPSPAPGSGRVSGITLFRSDLSGERPAYEPLHTVVLRQAADSRPASPNPADEAAGGEPGSGRLRLVVLDQQLTVCQCARVTPPGTRYLFQVRGPFAPLPHDTRVPQPIGGHIRWH